jgi:DNA-binding NarL/FixJ family response regulator
VQPRNSTSVLLFERHALLREAVRSLIDATEGLAVIGESADLDDAVARARTLRPDVILMDGRFDSAERDIAVAALNSAAPHACVLVLADDDARMPGANARALADCIPRDCGVREFCETIASRLGVQCAGCAMRPACSGEWGEVTLSRRETHVAVRVAAGLSSKQIAGELGLGLRTVHTYRESLARKLGSSSAAVVTRFVIERGIADAADHSAPIARPSVRRVHESVSQP